MTTDPKKSVPWILGELTADVKFLVEAEKKRQAADEALDDRVTSLEQTRFKLYFIVTAVGGLVGFVSSKVDKGIEWLKNLA
jgi:hypothetical protein